MTKSYGTYCPVALATETLGERWTILIILSLIDGCERFNDLHRSLPRISPSVLAQRLTLLEDADILEKRQSTNGKTTTYSLTKAGWELEPIIRELARWGQRWARNMEPDDLDPRSLGWSMHNRLNLEAMPKGQTVMQFNFSGSKYHPSAFWIVKKDSGVDLCVKHPGFDVDLEVHADIRLFTEVWRGFRSIKKEIAAGHIKLQGEKGLKKAFPDWLLLSLVAPIKRERPGPEKSGARV